MNKIQIGAALPVLGPLKFALLALDYPFVLPSLWKYPHYRDAHIQLGKTWGIVDNDVHDKGIACSVDTIATILNDAPGWIGILPDVIHKPVATWNALIQTCLQTGISPKHWGIVLHGNDVEVMRFQFDLAHELGFGLICFPYRALRHVYLHPDVLYFRGDQRYHLMGLSERDSLITYGHLPGRWSIDTTKLYKADLTTKPWHGFTHQITDAFDLDLLKRNIDFLRKAFHGTSGAS